MLIIKSFSATIERPGLESLPDGNKEAKGVHDCCRGLQEGQGRRRGPQGGQCRRQGPQEVLDPDLIAHVVPTNRGPVINPDSEIELNGRVTEDLKISQIYANLRPALGIKIIRFCLALHSYVQCSQC